jgi:lipoprotein-anchoring transpeptidase ErfK/SrfK
LPQVLYFQSMSSSLVVKTGFQQAELWKNGSLIKSYVVSTARNGLGCVPESLCTPYGKLKIARKIGDGLPRGAVLRNRVPTGEIWTVDPDNPIFADDQDMVLSRILWLEGCEPHNMTTFARMIYMQGTNREGLLGTPDSGGSIRFANDDIIELYDLLQVGNIVEVE